MGVAPKSGMNPEPENTDPTLPQANDEKPQPSAGPLKNEPTPERAAVEKERQERQARKQS
jgi:hypothetical protein